MSLLIKYSLFIALMDKKLFEAYNIKDMRTESVCIDRPALNACMNE